DDVTFTVMPMPNMAPALSNGAVDAAWLFEPFVAQITSAGIGKMLTATGQVAPQHYGGGLPLSAPLAHPKPPAGRPLCTAFMRGQRDYYRAFILRETSDADRESIVNLWIKYTAVKDRSMYDKLSYVTIEPNGFVDPAVLEEFQEWAFQRGRLPQKV